jgi:glycosyltransferase involved in cell wall biosynthesis
MNLLFASTAYPPSIGGAQIYAHRLAIELSRSSADGGRGREDGRSTVAAVRVVCAWDSTRRDWLLGTSVGAERHDKTYALDGIPVTVLGLPTDVQRRLWPAVVAYFTLQAWMLPVITRAWAAAMRPHADRAELVHAFRIGREPFNFAALEVARQRDIPFILTPHHHPRWGTWLHRHYHRLYRAADGVIALTTAEREALVRLGVDEQRITVTGIGPVLAEQADGGRFRATHGLGAEPVVLFLGQKYPYKGYELLLTAATQVWAQAPETRFVFVGPRTPESRRRFASVQDPRILELDAVDLQTKTDALAAADVFCLPSREESFGGVYTEAWALGKPVIALDTAVSRSLIDPGGDGLLATADPAHLADHALCLLREPAWAARLGAAGRAKVHARYSWPSLAAQTCRAYARAGMPGTSPGCKSEDSPGLCASGNAPCNLTSYVDPNASPARLG